MMLQFDELVKEGSTSTCFAFDTKKVWIPRSLMGKPDLTFRTVEVQGWFALQRGLEVYSVDLGGS